MVERIERRVLAAVRFVDRATNARIGHFLRVQAEGVTFIRNRSGLYVVTQAPSLAEHTQSFSQPPALPPLGSVLIRGRVDDPSGTFLPRLFALNLPRPANAAQAMAPNSLFTPIEVALYAAATRPLALNWSVLRASVVSAGNGNPVVGALLRVVNVANGFVLASGASDARGEALVVIPGVPVTQFGSTDDNDNSPATGPVVVTEMAARIEVSQRPSATWPDDFDQAEGAHASAVRLTRDITLRSGRTETAVLVL